MPVLIGPFRQILTLRRLPDKGAIRNDQLEIIKNGGIAIAHDMIYDIGSFEKLKDRYDECIEIEGPMVATPGLIDCHSHMVWGGTRAADFERRNSGLTYQQILEEGGGIMETVRRTREAGKASLKTAFEERLERHLRDGITTVEVKSGYGLDVETELKMLRIVRDAQSSRSPNLIATFLGAHVCPPEFDRVAYLEFLLNDVVPLIRDESLAQRADAFIEHEAFPVKLIKPYLQQLQKLGFDLSLHTGQFSKGGTALAVELGARSADHLESISEDELGALARSSTLAVALPGASIGLGMPFTPARRLLDEGAGLAIATDWNPGSAPMGDLLGQASILATYEKLSAAEVWAALTFRASHVLALNDRGTLDINQCADLLGYPTDDYREILYHQGRMRPVRIWKSGEEITTQQG